MRFREFKILKEDASKLYTIGDSHAVAVATAGGKDWVNLAIGGRSSTDPSMLANIAKIPKGATVLVSQGANDTANAMRASMESKKPPRDPKAIASNVANVVSKVEAQGAKVIFMLFPNGPGRGPGLAKYYGGDYQEDVRNAIKSAISVPIIDINGKPLTDGVHATMGVYKEVANQVKSRTTPTASSSEIGKPLGSPGQQSRKPATARTTTLSVPQGRINPEIADIQKVLVALGYELPRHGIDGVRGPETMNAVKQFQQDYGLSVDGDPGPQTVEVLNSLIDKKGIKFDKSSQDDIKAQVRDTTSLPPAQYNAVTKGKIGKLLDLIAGPESGGHYDIMMGGKRNPKILDMTINEILRYQTVYKAGGAETAAAGRYQFMPATLREQATKLGLNFDSDKFDPATQDKLAINLLRQKGMDRWLEGRMDDSTFMDRLSQVWAGLPSPSKNGRSWYHGVGSNRAHISVASVQSALDDIKSA